MAGCCCSDFFITVSHWNLPLGHMLETQAQTGTLI
jgi:hypothetical protein